MKILTTHEHWPQRIKNDSTVFMDPYHYLTTKAFVKTMYKQYAENQLLLACIKFSWALQ